MWVGIEMSQWRYINDIIGICLGKKDDWICECSGGWGGKYCRDRVCDGYNLCKPYGINTFFYINYFNFFQLSEYLFLVVFNSKYLLC